MTSLQSLRKIHPRTIFLSLLALAAVFAAWFVLGGELFYSENYAASTSYYIVIGDEAPTNLPIPGAVVITGVQEDKNLDFEALRQLASLDFSFSPAPKLQTHVRPDVILYGIAHDATGYTTPCYYIDATVELKGRVHQSFPGGVRYAPLDGREFRDLLTNEIQSRVGSDIKFTVISPEEATVGSSNALFGEKTWQLKKRP